MSDPGRPPRAQTGPPPRGQAWPWWLLCAALGLPALLLPTVPLSLPVPFWPEAAQVWALQPGLGLQQPAWTWWTTAWLHGSEAHLWRNLAGLIVLALMGAIARPGGLATLAWLTAWPLTQLGMLAEPGLGSYVGLSGVLHAGVMVLALRCLQGDRRARDGLPGAVLLAWLAGKLLMENPWAHSLVASDASAINVAPWAHLSGAAAGLLSMVAWRLAVHRRRHNTART